MSITSVNLLREKQVTGTPEGLVYTRRYRVLTDNAATTEKQVLANPSLPVFYKELVDDTSVVCKRRAAAQNLDNLLEWIVTCEYGTRTGNEPDSGTTPTKPTDEDPQISFGFARYIVPVYKAYKPDGTDKRGAQSIPVRNSAGDEFDPPVTEEKTTLLITIVRNEKVKDFDPENAYNFIGTVNKTKVLVAGINFAAWCALIRDMSGIKMWDSTGVAYYQVTYQIEGDPDNHQKKVLDQGYYAMVDDVRVKLKGKHIVPVADTKSPDSFVSEPQLLDKTGKLFTPTAEEKAKYIDFYTKFAQSWSTLSLPKTY